VINITINYCRHFHRSNSLLARHSFIITFYPTPFLLFHKNTNLKFTNHLHPPPISFLIYYSMELWAVELLMDILYDCFNSLFNFVFSLFTLPYTRIIRLCVGGCFFSNLSTLFLIKLLSLFATFITLWPHPPSPPFISITFSITEICSYFNSSNHVLTTQRINLNGY